MHSPPAQKPPYHALNRTAGKNVMKGTAFWPINGVRAIRRSVAAKGASIAAPYAIGFLGVCVLSTMIMSNKAPHDPLEPRKNCTADNPKLDHSVRCRE